MIPLKLKLSGFLSYRDEAVLDFSGFDLACISGYNGAGKSSLLDAITWALFGQARKRDESLINLQSDAAEVVFTFEYEGNVYRVQRTMPRGKAKVLEFQIRTEEGEWRPLTERTLRETQNRIEQTLRLDYETFVNAAFFLQGKADTFTQQNATRRKEVLSGILGLEQWSVYRARAMERRRRVEQDLGEVDGRMAEIHAELLEADKRKATLARLKKDLARLQEERKSQEEALEAVKRANAELDKRRELVGMLYAALTRARASLEEKRSRLAEREAKRKKTAALLDRASEIEAAYAAWEASRQKLAYWEEIALLYRKYEEKRREPLAELQAERARLEQEHRTLLAHFQEIERRAARRHEMEAALEKTKETLRDIESRLAEKVELEASLQTLRSEIAALESESARLSETRVHLRERIDSLSAVEGAACPLCGQPLSEEKRLALLTSLREEDAALASRVEEILRSLDSRRRTLEEGNARLKTLAKEEQTREKESRTLSELSVRLETLDVDIRRWEEDGAHRLAEVAALLENESYAPEVRARLAALDEEIAKVGYDPQAHEAVRQEEAKGRASEKAYRELAEARAALTPLEEEIENLRAGLAQEEEAFAEQESVYEKEAASLAAAEAEAPDENAAYAALLRLREKENRLNQEVGAAQQKVDILKDLRKRMAELNAAREALTLQISRYQRLERAFGKDGVPALLIEQALPEIEAKANELLARLSDGQMSVRFLTQTAYKDKKRKDLRETLDIQISDSAGARDYETYSGGEAFRVNFAIRLALSEILSRRKGARLQTLIIDEGFGSQDALGQRRLIEAINQIRGDFAKILVITHVDALKEAFPARIEVEKVEGTSTVRVVM